MGRLGKHYNFNRDYNPLTGRYVQSDPIGLDGGLNGYAYARANSLRFVDREGLDASLNCKDSMMADPSDLVCDPEPLTWKQVKVNAFVNIVTMGFGGLAARSTTKGTVTNANFAQNNTILSSKAFSKQGQAILSAIAKKPILTVGHLTEALRSGAVKPSQAPVDFVNMNGVRLILNTRTSTALQNAGIPRNKWHGRDKTGVIAYDNVTFNDLAATQLKNNNLPPTGSPTLGN